MKKIINIDLVPNFEEDDIKIIKNLKNFHQEDIEKFKEEVLKILDLYFPESKVYFFNSARSALTFLLQILGKGVAFTQSFTCLVVPNAIKLAGWKPVYIDIDESFNIDIKDLKLKFKEIIFSKNSGNKIIIIQNTFGIPAKIEEILNFARENKIFVIENLTHSLGAKYNGNYLGNFGDFSLLSFNRNKVISSIIGGALVVRNKNFLEKIEEEYKNLEEKNDFDKIVFTGVWLYKLRENYNFLNRKLSAIFRKLGITLEMISSEEKSGQKPVKYLFKFPEKLFPLLLNQLKKLERFNNYRKEIAKIYMDSKLKFENINKDQIDPIFLRYPILINNRDRVYEKFRKMNIYLGDWYFCPLYPCVDLKIFDYEKGSCPKAESVCQKILNLPTHIEKDEAEFILKNL